MGLTINYLGGSRNAHLKKRTAKHEKEERLERQRLAQHRIEEAIRRAARSNTAARYEDASTTTAAGVAGQRAWAFVHARREGERRMGPAATPRQSYSGSAYASTSAKQLEKKRRLLLATEDWTGLRSRSHSRSRSHTSVERATPSSTYVKSNRLSPVLPSRSDQIMPKVEHACFEQHDTSLSTIDLNMPSSPPGHVISSSIATQDSMSDYMRLSMTAKLEEVEDIKETISLPGHIQDAHISSYESNAASRADSDLISNATSSNLSTQGLSSERGDFTTQASIVSSPPTSEDGSPGLQWLPEPYRSMKHISEISHAPIVFNFLMPCMLGDCRPPFVYDDTVIRSNDYLQMACAGPDMED